MCKIIRWLALALVLMSLAAGCATLPGPARWLL
jgi:hypothetical protein